MFFTFRIPTRLLAWWQQSRFVFGFTIPLPSYFDDKHNNGTFTCNTSSINQSHTNAYINDQYILPLASAIKLNGIERIPPEIIYTIHEFANVDRLLEDYRQWQTAMIQHKNYYFVVPLMLGYIELFPFLVFVRFIMLRVLRIESAWLSLVFRGLDQCLMQSNNKVSDYVFYYWLIVCLHFVCAVICYLECCKRQRLFMALEHKLSETEREYSVFKIKDHKADKKVCNLFSFIPLQHWLNFERTNIIKYHFVNRWQRGHYFGPFYLENNACKLWLLYCRYHLIAVYYLLYQYVWRRVVLDDAVSFCFMLPSVLMYQFDYCDEFRDGNAYLKNTWKQMGLHFTVEFCKRTGWGWAATPFLVKFLRGRMTTTGADNDSGIARGNEGDAEGESPAANASMSALYATIVGVCSPVYSVLAGVLQFFVGVPLRFIWSYLQPFVEHYIVYYILYYIEVIPEYDSVLFGIACGLCTVATIAFLIWGAITAHHTYYVLPRYLIAHARRLQLPPTASDLQIQSMWIGGAFEEAGISVLEDINSLPLQRMHLPVHTSWVASRFFGAQRGVSCRLLPRSLYMCFGGMSIYLIVGGVFSCGAVGAYTQAMGVPMRATFFWSIPCVLWCLALAFVVLLFKQESQCVMSGFNRAQYAFKYMAPNIYLYVWRQLLTFFKP